jgi:hypothetical protein
LNTMGAVEVPELWITTVSLYVPEETSTASPADATSPALLMVQKGRASVPGPESEQSGCARST